MNEEEMEGTTKQETESNPQTISEHKNVAEEIAAIRAEYEAIIKSERQAREKERAETAAKMRAFIVGEHSTNDETPHGMAGRLAERLSKKYKRI